MLWEKPRFRFSKPKKLDPGEKLGEMEMPIRGMELALTTCTTFPIRMIDEELKRVLQVWKKQIGLKLEQAKCSMPFDVATAPETNKREHSDSSLWTKKPISTINEDLSPFFFLYCMELLQEPDHCIVNEEATEGSKGKSRVDVIKWLRGERMIFAIKCSLSLGLAVFFGLIYNKENGYWSGLTIAISFVTGRQATFTMANTRAQGTAMGSIYGIICCFIFQKLADLRVLLLLPWIIFTTFLRHSRMYGQAGGISAVIGALLILGRKNYGTPSEFAIARITEATIGLICFIAVEIALNPVRSATLAKRELSRTLTALQDCFEAIGLYKDEKGVLTEMREKQRNLKSHVSELENFIAEAEMEPNFWFLPFQSDCYNKLLRSISEMADILPFVIHQIEFLSQASQRLGIVWEEIQELINNDLEHLRKKIDCLMKCLDEVLLVKTLEELEKECDLESGKSANPSVSIPFALEQNSIADIIGPFLQRTMEVANKTEGDELDEKLKSQMVLFLSSLGFCINIFKTEAIETEKEIGELLKWENPARHVNLHELLYKFNAT
ncbi:Para-hydroxybenzoic acid efflux pump subunit AaeB/fusaric acid resistance protein [Corchorus capsularis]|uniref:Para-hydroxybenzoic acid efflux pump subunit AaeB/fusaric acid resistance protein n=1 Tax=Corchorus capsularis TaxID=210143 RepID=A0A1R3H7D1_COCAP|nr:Para-hydroxybenzoic acid efflux pump subunit AaeB/fusaric acid resistance protein [Corchorus capsularis]